MAACFIFLLGKTLILKRSKVSFPRRRAGTEAGVSSEVSRQDRTSCSHRCKASKKKQQESPTLKSSLWFTHISSKDIEIPQHCLLETHHRASHPQYSSAADTMSPGGAPDGLQPCSGGRIFTADPTGAPRPLLRPPPPHAAHPPALYKLRKTPKHKHGTSGRCVFPGTDSTGSWQI